MEQVTASRRAAYSSNAAEESYHLLDDSAKSENTAAFFTSGEYLRNISDAITPTIFLDASEETHNALSVDSSCQAMKWQSSQRRGGYRIWRRGGPDFQPRSCEEELFFAVFCDMREPV